MKILITGGSGLLGQYLNIELNNGNEILTLYNENAGNCADFNSEKTDITDFEKLRIIFEKFKPDITIHTAAISRPELCDKLPPEFVNKVNVISTEVIAKLCRDSDSKILFTSTDLVYDGDKGGMVKEDCEPNPVSLYAETKILSEEKIRSITDNHIILRTSLLFGTGLNHSVNNFHNMLDNFRKGMKSKLFYDQFRTPLSLKEAARIISELIKMEIKGETVNFGGSERVSRTELGEIVCRAGDFDLALIERTSMYDMDGLHKVADVSMNTDKLRTLGIRQKSIEESVAEILTDYI